MAIPLRYNVRSVRMRWITALMTVLGIALVTGVFEIMFSLGIGMERSLVSTGHPLNLIVLRARATETQSEVTRQQAQDIASRDGIALDARGEPLISPELVVIASLPKAGGGKANMAIRGVGPKAREVRNALRLREGRWFRPGLYEVVVGRGAAPRFEGLGVGETIVFKGKPWTVSGVFEADGQTYESELWCDLDMLRAAYQRDYSTLIIRCAGETELERLKNVIADDKQIQLEAKRHADYYREQNMGANMLKAMGVMMGFVLAIGAIFGAANTMYAAVASRTREIATMRVLGFSRLAIWFSFILESAAIGLAGGALGSVFAWVAVDGQTTGTANWQTFTDMAFQFQVTPGLMVAGALLAMLTGVVGGFFPAWRASRVTIAQALRGL